MAVFVSVVAHGSLSRASRELHMPLPTVSRKLSELESHVKAKLLIRSTRKLLLTEAGEAYVQACKRILEEVAEADRAAAGHYREPRGELVLTAPIVFGRLHVLPLVAEFLSLHAAVDVRLVLTDRALSLIDDHLDIAVRIGSLPDTHLVAVRIGEIRTIVCASPVYLQRHGTPKSPEQLASHQCVTFASITNANAWVLRGGQSVPIRSRLVVNTAEAAIDGALLGLGLTQLLSYQVAAAVRAGKLVRVLRRYEPPPAPVNLIYPAELRLTAKVRAFIDFAVPKLRECLLASSV
jgi:DNA-binding transcriptional LysR family regulator